MTTTTTTCPDTAHELLARIDEVPEDRVKRVLGPWCDHGELPLVTCACPRCRPDVTVHMGQDTAIILPSQVVHRYRAHFDGPAAGCGHSVHRGELVAKTPAGWVCAECDPGDPHAPEPADGVTA